MTKVEATWRNSSILLEASIKKAQDEGKNVSKYTRYSFIEIVAHQSLFNWFKNEPRAEELINLALHRVLDKARQEKTIDNSLLGNLIHKLPKIPKDVTNIGGLGIEIGENDLNNLNVIEEHEIKIIQAKILLQYLFDTDQLNHKVEHKKLMVDLGGKKQWKFYQERFIINDEVTPKDKLFGLWSEPAKVTNKYYRTKVGARQIKINKRTKDVLRKLSSIGFELNDMFDSELIRHYYRISKQYLKTKTGLIKETEDQYIQRTEGYLSLIENHIGNGTWFLSYFVDSRGRLTPDFNMFGVNPHGSLFESLQWQYAEAYEVTDSMIDTIKWMFVVHVDISKLIIKAIKKFDKNQNKYLDACRKEGSNLFAVTNHKKLGELWQVKQALEVFDNYNKGIKEAKYLFEFDKTNSGIGLMGLLQKNNGTAKMGNLYGKIFMDNLSFSKMI